MVILSIRKDLKLGKKRNKNRGPKNNTRKSNNPHYNTYTSYKVSSQQINTLAYSVFGSLYYNPVED